MKRPEYDNDWCIRTLCDQDCLKGYVRWRLEMDTRKRTRYHGRHSVFQYIVTNKYVKQFETYGRRNELLDIYFGERGDLIEGRHKLIFNFILDCLKKGDWVTLRLIVECSSVDFAHLGFRFMVTDVDKYPLDVQNALSHAGVRTKRAPVTFVSIRTVERTFSVTMCLES